MSRYVGMFDDDDDDLPSVSAIFKAIKKPRNGKSIDHQVIPEFTSIKVKHDKHDASCIVLTDSEDESKQTSQSPVDHTSTGHQPSHTSTKISPISFNISIHDLREENIFEPLKSKQRKRKSGDGKAANNDKEKRKIERERLKKEKSAAKELEKRNNQLKREVAQSQSLNACMKTINVVIDRSIIDSSLCYEADLTSLLKEGGSGLKITDNLISRSIIWLRNKSTLSSIDDENNHLIVEKRQTEDEQIMIFLDSQLIIALVAQSMGIGTDDNPTFYSYVNQLKEEVKLKKLTIVLHGLEAYFRKEKNKEHREFRKAVDGKNYNLNHNIATIKPTDVDFIVAEALIKLNNLPPHMNSFRVLKIENSIQAAQLVYHFTKAVAQALIKRMENDNFDWYAQGDNKMTVNIKEEKDITKLWKRQLMQFPSVSCEVADSIVLIYPTPQSLMKAYSKRLEDENEELLKDIIIKRRYAKGTEKNRKVGVELSRKVYRLFTSRNKKEFLNN